MAFKENNIIDIHTHLFNLKYLPIWGILKSRGVGENTSKFIEFLLLSITVESFSRQDGLKELFNYEEKEYPEIYNQFDDYELLEILIENAQNNETILHSPLLEKAIIENEQVLKRIDVFTLIEDVTTEDYKYNAIRWIVNKVLKGFAYLRWFLFMTTRETKLLKSLRKNYPMVKTFVFHMLDTEFFFPGDEDFSAKAALSNAQQIANMKALMLQYPESIKGFVGYNPKRENGLEVVKKALENGFSGIKFYPPLGYNPTESIELFRYCEKNKIAVFTHCTPTGFEAIPKVSGANANPENWQKVLDVVPNLKLCLGHAGGVNGWFDPIEEDEILKPCSYAKKVVELCTTYKNVYAEVGFLDHIENTNEENYFVHRLVHLFKDTSTNFNLSSKLMYGSDWHVLMNHKGQLFKNYALEFLKLFEREELTKLPNYEQIKEQFFYLNAENYLHRP